jgi:signal transduction histidine kinase
VPNLIRTLWREPRVANAPAPRWQDWLLAGLAVCLAGVEVTFRQDLPWRFSAGALTVAFALALPWRRRYPAQLTALVFTVNGSAQSYALLHGAEWYGLYTTALILILPYALLRWGSGRDICVGLGVIAATFVVTTGIENPPWSDIIGGALFLLFPAALGATMRYQDAAQRRAREQVRLREREQLARDLHDTVGHYVSAIAVQAQAGRAIASTRPEAPLEALGIIEDAASRALGEMRAILRAMRDDDAAALAPAASLADIERLAGSGTYPFTVQVSLSGSLDNLDATIVSTLYRLAQESITNAARHARHAKLLAINITGEAGQLQLQIDDDGEPIARPTPVGLGLQGMRERVTLLGGTLDAGPGPQRGWSVRAILPRAGPDT